MKSTFVYLLLYFIIPVDGQTFFDIKDLDWSIRPTDDFFTFVNGRWINQTIIPSSETDWGGVFTMTHETLFQLKGILDELTRNGTSESPHPVDSINRKLSDLYLTGLDEQTIERVGIEPLKKTLIQLQNINTYQELIMFILNWYRQTDQGLIFTFDVFPDERNSSVNMVIWKQTGLLLPERDYYFRNDPISKNIRLNYINYIDRLLNLTNEILDVTTNLIDAEDVLTLETQLAVSHRTPFELRDPEKNYNKFTVIELDRMMPNLGWHRILNVLTITNMTVLMDQPDYYQSLDKLILSQSLNVWKNKIRFTLLHGMSRYLTKNFSQARFHMFNHLLYGQLEEKVRWMRIIDDMNKYIGELLGQLYVYRYFSNEAKQNTLNLVNHLIDVYHERIVNNKWMSNITKEKALIKLNKINKKIGYPSKWKSYNTVYINRWSYFDSMLSIFQYNYRKKINDLKKLPDRDEWFLPPQIVNAFYNPLFNEIIFPAGILQEPFFLFNADDAINYGAVGSIIGHELTHGFDDQGRKYNENGNLHPWWTPKDINEFNSRTKIIIEQFNNYQVLNTHINGLLTLGENIADLGGVEIAYEAFLQTKQAQDGILIDGLTPKQRFFLSFARAWRMKMTDAKLVSIIKVDPHAPPIARVNGPLSNMMGFYQTFNVTKGDGLFRDPSQRVLIW